MGVVRGCGSWFGRGCHLVARRRGEFGCLVYSWGVIFPWFFGIVVLLIRDVLVNIGRVVSTEGCPINILLLKYSWVV